MDNDRFISNPIYNISNPVGLKYLTRLRLELSNLNENKFKLNFQDCINPLCSCNLEPESNFHFFLHCHHCTILRPDLMNGLKKTDENILGPSENSLVKLPLFGDPKYNLVDNCHILYGYINFILRSKVLKVLLCSICLPFFFPLL